MEYRPARPQDLPELYGVFRAAVEDLFGRHAFEPPRPPEEVFVRQHRHLLDHDSERFWVAEENHRPVGFGAALVRDDTWFLSALFVAPDRQAAGVGKELLHRAWDADRAGIRRRLTIVDAIQPISTGMYSRAGLLPVAPLLNLAGEPNGKAAADLEPAGVDEGALALLDSAAYGFDRALDHVFWRRDARVTLWLRKGDPVAYGYRWPGGRIGPVAGRTPEDTSAALASELARAAGRFVTLIVPGTARPALAAALTAGLRYTDPPGLILSTDGAGPAALVPHGYSLF